MLGFFSWIRCTEGEDEGRCLLGGDNARKQGRSHSLEEFKPQL